jgi:hypothetical protein
MTWWDRVMCDYPLADPADQGREFETSDLGGFGGATATRSRETAG